MTALNRGGGNPAAFVGSGPADHQAAIEPVQIGLRERAALAALFDAGFFDGFVGGGFVGALRQLREAGWLDSDSGARDRKSGENGE